MKADRVYSQSDIRDNSRLPNLRENMSTDRAVLGVRSKGLALVLVVLGMLLWIGSVIVNLQDVGSCPAQPVGTPFTCDHAYPVGGTYIWMRPLYTGLGILSILLSVSALAVVIYWKSNSWSPSNRPIN